MVNKAEEMIQTDQWGGAALFFLLNNLRRGITSSRLALNSWCSWFNLPNADFQVCAVISSSYEKASSN